MNADADRIVVVDYGDFLVLTVVEIKLNETA